MYQTEGGKRKGTNVDTALISSIYEDWLTGEVHIHVKAFLYIYRKCSKIAFQIYIFFLNFKHPF